MSVLRVQFERFFEALNRRRGILFQPIGIAEGVICLPGLREPGNGRLQNENGAIQITHFGELAAVVDRVILTRNDKALRVVHKPEVFTDGRRDPGVHGDILRDVLRQVVLEADVIVGLSVEQTMDFHDHLVSLTDKAAVAEDDDDAVITAEMVVECLEELACSVMPEECLFFPGIRVLDLGDLSREAVAAGSEKLLRQFPADIADGRL